MLYRLKNPKKPRDLCATARLPGEPTAHPSSFTTLLPVGMTARLLYIPPTWLRAEAEAGRIPHLRAGKVHLFDLDLVEKLLIERPWKGECHER
jgi:hypothetical protein